VTTTTAAKRTSTRELGRKHIVDKVNQSADRDFVATGDGAMRPIDQRADVVRHFNRFYTHRIGALGAAHLGSEFSLTEVRVLYELAHGDPTTASGIAAALEIDRGYLSRMLRAFKRRGLIATRRDADDRRHTHLALTAAGRNAFAPLDRKARDEIVRLLAPLSDARQRRVVSAMTTIRGSLEPRPAPAARQAEEPFALRSHRPGDMGWIVHRHGALYQAEYGYDERFEALVARVVADFIEHLDPARERCWIAERKGEIVGSVFVVAKSKHVAKLRLLLVEPSARGLGIGKRLVHEVVQFARGAGYRKVVLWTQSELTAARRIYRAAGFRCVREESHRSFGTPAVAEVWELKL
jgi:DNA-binding MarR family transcriptional regulator/GNAT superfamily N-acetyltransferase